jgi:DNA-binding transcriptional LysR family regulator
MKPTDNDFLEPERLRAFVAVAETGNFTRAAERLHRTQPTVSIQVRRLEEDIGRPLFERNAQFVRLTADGEAMLASLRAAVLAGVGVAVFGVGMIPNRVNVLPHSLLPALADAEYLLDWRPDCTDRVVIAFGSILRLTAPLIIQQLVDDQTPLVLAAAEGS